MLDQDVMCWQAACPDCGEPIHSERGGGSVWVRVDIRYSEITCKPDDANLPNPKAIELGEADYEVDWDTAEVDYHSVEGDEFVCYECGKEVYRNKDFAWIPLDSDREVIKLSDSEKAVVADHQDGM